MITLLAFLHASGEAAVAPRIENPGFETTPVLRGWESHVYGGQPEIAGDDGIAREGKRSLRVTAGDPSDTAFGQELVLQAGLCYRFSGWVRTRDLDPHGSPVFGTFQIQQAGGRGTIATGPNHGGDTDWAEVSILFRAPANGVVQVALFFVGYGKGTGTVWFDDLKIEGVELGMSPVKVTRDSACPGQIAPFQYGQFIEYLCDLVPGMWAEKLSDTSFEGLTPYDVSFIKETDFREKPWYPSGAVNRAQFVLDRESRVSGEVSQKIAVSQGPPCLVGVSQDGIALSRGETCTLTVYMRQEGLEGSVAVRLHHEGEVYASCEFEPGPEWKKYTALLTPTDTDSEATLTIEFRGPGSLWLDNVSLSPEDSVGGWRRDVVDAVRDLKSGIIRFGGSAVEYSDWRDTIGDPDRRKPFRAWGGLQPTGPGLEEIVQFCRAVGAEPLICVRFSGCAPKDAADQVEYLNGAPDTPMGAQRAENGHPEPYRIMYWQVGNEVSGPDYEANLAEFCKAMKLVDPSIKLLSAAPTPDLIRNGGEYIDYVAPHHYGCADIVRMESDIAAIRKMIAQNAPGRRIKIAVTEWNTTAGDWGTGRAMLWTLENALACSRYHNLLHRNCDIVEIANRSNLVNSFCSGIIQTDNHRLYKTPTYYAQQLYSTLAGVHPLRIESDIAANLGPDISATLSADGRTVTLFVVNDSSDDMDLTLDFSSFGGKRQEIPTWTLADREGAGEPDVTNSFADPERVAPVCSAYEAPSPSFEYRFPALSLTVMKWAVETESG